MKSTKFISFTTIVILIALSILGCKEKTTETKPATAEELGQMNRDFIKALQAKDAVAAANLYAEDASILPPNEPTITGRANIQKYWQNFLDAGFVDGSVHTTSTGSNGDLGYEIGTFEIKFKDKDGKVISEKGKYTEVLKRNAEGKWISIYGMWSSDFPAE